MGNLRNLNVRKLNVFILFNLLVDYILITKKNIRNLEEYFNLNKDEVAEIKFISKDELKAEVYERNMDITPWFKLILDRKIDELFKLSEDFEDLKEKEKLDITRFI